MRRGYTLVELVVVLAIVAILAAISMPIYSRGPDLQLSLAVDQFIADLYHTRQLSACHGTAYIQYWNGLDKGNYQIFDNGKIIKQSQLPDKVFFGISGGDITYGSGWPVTGYTLLITSSQAKRKRLVVIALSTGRIRSSVY